MESIGKCELPGNCATGQQSALSPSGHVYISSDREAPRPENASYQNGAAVLVISEKGTAHRMDIERKAFVPRPVQCPGMNFNTHREALAV